MTIASDIQKYFTDPITQIGLLDRIVAAWHFTGSGYNAQKNSSIGNFTFTGVNTVNGDFTANGYQGDGVSKYLKLGFSPASQNLNINDIQFIIYGANIGATSSGAYILMDAHDGARRNLLMRENTEYKTDFDSDASNTCFVTTGVADGFVAARSVSPGTLLLNLNGERVAIDMFCPYRSGLASTGEVSLGAYDNVGTAVFPTTAQFRFAAVTKGMSDREMRLFYNCVAQLQVALGRPANGETAQTLIVTQPQSNQVYQMDTNETQNVTLEGLYFGSGTATIQASINNVTWLDVATVSSGYWKGFLMRVPKGQYTVKIRASTAPSTVITKTLVGVGHIVVGWGQSNSAGQFNSPQPYTYTDLAASAYRFDGGGWLPYGDPSGAYIGGGSVYGPLASLLAAYTNAPIAILNCGKGSTKLVGGEWNPVNGAQLDRALYMAKQLESKALVLIGHQGESDTEDGLGDDFYNNAVQVIDKFKQVLGNRLVAIQNQIGQVGVSTTSNIDSIRSAIAKLWKDKIAGIGGIYWYLQLADGLHLTTNSEAQLSAQQIFRSIKSNCFNLPGLDPIVFNSATYKDNKVKVYLTPSTLNLTPGSDPKTGFKVVDGVGTKTITSAVYDSLKNSIELACYGGDLSEPVTISYGSGNDTGTILDDDPDAPKPCIPFIAKAVYAQDSITSLFTIT